MNNQTKAGGVGIFTVLAIVLAVLKYVKHKHIEAV